MSSTVSGPLASVLNYVHRTAGAYRPLARLAAYARNQLQCVIAFHLGESSDGQRNGEYALVRQLAPHCETFADVGAHEGEWTAQLLELTRAEGTLFEPGSMALRHLRNRFPSGPVIEGVAVCDRVGEIEFVEDAAAGQGSSAAEAFDPRLPVRGRSKVQCTTLDVYFGGEKRVDFVKIDTEGYDLKVLYGARGLLEGQRIRFVQFEYNSSWLATGSTLRAAYSYLEGLGYSVFLVRSDGLYDLDRAFWGDYFRYSNFFACRRADLEAVRPLLRGRL